MLETNPPQGDNKGKKSKVRSTPFGPRPAKQTAGATAAGPDVSNSQMFGWLHEVVVAEQKRTKRKTRVVVGLAILSFALLALYTQRSGAQERIVEVEKIVEVDKVVEVPVYSNLNCGETSDTRNSVSDIAPSVPVPLIRTDSGNNLNSAEKQKNTIIKHTQKEVNYV